MIDHNQMSERELLAWAKRQESPDESHGRVGAAVLALLARADAAESREKALRGFLWTLRYGDGCICEGGPFDPEYPHTDRCRSWQTELTDEHRAALAWNL